MSRIAHENIEQLHIDSFYTLFISHFSKEYSFVGHIHNMMEFQYVRKGSICASVGENVYHLSAGEILFIQPLSPHKHHVTSDNGAVLLVSLFNMEGELCSYFYNKVFKLSDFQQKTMESLIEYLQKKCTSPIQEEEGRFSQNFLESYPSLGYIQMITTYMYQLFFSLTEEGDLRYTSMTPDAQLFRKAVSYLNEKVCLFPSIDEIAAYCNTSRSTLIRIFDKYSGISIHKYLLMLKIKAATELLQSGETVTNTAEKLGFSSQAYFSACYKRETGVSPSEIK